MFKKSYFTSLLITMAFAIAISFGCSNSTFSGMVGSETGSNDGNNNTSGTSGEFGDQGSGDDSNFGNGNGSELNAEFDDVGYKTSSCTSLRDASLDNVNYFSPNMVPDGDFEKSSSEINSDFTYNSLSSCVDGDSLIPDIGEYSIVVNPQRCHRAWDSLGDSKIAIFNGAVGSRFWCRTFDVVPNTRYAFAVEERLLHPSGGVDDLNGASPLRWTIDNTDIIPPSSPIQKWRTRGAVWSSGAKSSITLCGRNDSTNNSGNDWAIDNICLVPQNKTN